MTYSFDKAALDSKMKKIIKNTDLSKVMDEIGADLRSETQMNFRKKKSPEGKSWEKFKESTLKSKATRKRKPTKSPVLLQDDGYLRKSVDIYKSNSNTAEISSKLKYAATHQYGDNSIITKRAKKKGRSEPFGRNIPARPFMGITRRMVIRYNEMIRNYIVFGRTKK